MADQILQYHKLVYCDLMYMLCTHLIFPIVLLDGERPQFECYYVN